MALRDLVKRWTHDASHIAAKKIATGSLALADMAAELAEQVLDEVDPDREEGCDPLIDPYSNDPDIDDDHDDDDGNDEGIGDYEEGYDIGWSHGRDDDIDYDEDRWQPTEKADHGPRATSPLLGPKLIPVPMVNVMGIVPVLAADGMTLEEFTGTTSEKMMTVIGRISPTGPMRLIGVTATETYPDDPRTRVMNDADLKRLPSQARRQIQGILYGWERVRPAMMFKDLRKVTRGLDRGEPIDVRRDGREWQLFAHYKSRIDLLEEIILEPGDSVEASVAAVGRGHALGTLTLWMEPIRLEDPGKME
jgi:hypothetical protein